MFYLFTPTQREWCRASVWHRGAALGVGEERSRAGAFEQNSALALFCAGSASTAEQGRRPRRLRQRSDAKRLRTQNKPSQLSRTLLRNFLRTFHGSLANRLCTPCRCNTPAQFFDLLAECVYFAVSRHA